MNCDHLDELIEALAEGEPAAPEAARHLASCGRCQARLDLARDLARALDARELPVPPAHFTARVMARIQQEHWRAEIWVDWGFNIAVAAGVALVVAGAAGLAWSVGWLTVDRPTIELVGSALAPVAARAADQAGTVATAAALLSLTLAVWWWVEGDAAA